MIYHESLAYFVLEKSRWAKFPSTHTLTCGRVKFSDSRYNVEMRWRTKKEAMERMYPKTYCILETRYKDTWHYQVVDEKK